MEAKTIGASSFFMIVVSTQLLGHGNWNQWASHVCMHGTCMYHATGRTNFILHYLTGICGVIDGTYRYSRELLALDACRGSPTS